MRELLLNERWRPKTLDEMILLPRIREHFKDGLKQNVILHGHWGTGKTTLARILIGKWSKDKAFLEINASLDTSIEVLRTTIDDFCSNVYMGFDLNADVKNSDMKYVFLDECERISPAFQDALKAYIEQYSTKNVRFIFSTNHPEKLSGGMFSRMTAIDFNFRNPEEIKYLKREMYIRICKVICPAEGIEINKEVLIQLINDSFPDFRKILNSLQTWITTGEHIISSINQKSKEELFQILHDKSINYEKVFQFINSKIGADNVKSLLPILGSDYSQWFINNKKGDTEKLFQINDLVAKASMQLQFEVDPIIVAMSLIGNIRNMNG